MLYGGSLWCGVSMVLVVLALVLGSYIPGRTSVSQGIVPCRMRPLQSQSGIPILAFGW